MNKVFIQRRKSLQMRSCLRRLATLVGKDAFLKSRLCSWQQPNTGTLSTDEKNNFHIVYKAFLTDWFWRMFGDLCVQRR